MQKLKKQQSKNPDISTNLKNPPGIKCLGGKIGHVQEKEDV
jgi:hypothetical protein